VWTAQTDDTEVVPPLMIQEYYVVIARSGATRCLLGGVADPGGLEAGIGDPGYIQFSTFPVG